jgi:hypothetical protein
MEFHRSFQLPVKRRGTVALCSIVSKGRLPSVKDNSFYDDAIVIDKQHTTSEEF